MVRRMKNKDAYPCQGKGRFSEFCFLISDESQNLRESVLIFGR